MQPRIEQLTHQCGAALQLSLVSEPQPPRVPGPASCPRALQVYPYDASSASFFKARETVDFEKANGRTTSNYSFERVVKSSVEEPGPSELQEETDDDAAAKLKKPKKSRRPRATVEEQARRFFTVQILDALGAR